MIGSTRRIDTLGRIVLPKDLRQKLLIKPGDLLDISIYEEDSIIIKKNTLFDFGKPYIINLLKAASKNLNCNIYLISSEKIVYSPFEEQIGLKVNMDSQLNIKENRLDNCKIDKNIYINNNNYVRNININGDEYGYIIFEFKSSVPNNEYLNFIYNFLCLCIEM